MSSSEGLIDDHQAEFELWLRDPKEAERLEREQMEEIREILMENIHGKKNWDKKDDGASSNEEVSNEDDSDAVKMPYRNNGEASKKTDEKIESDNDFDCDRQYFCTKRKKFISIRKDDPKDPIEKERKRKKEEKWLKEQHKQMQVEMQRLSKEGEGMESNTLYADYDDY